MLVIWDSVAPIITVMEHKHRSTNTINRSRMKLRNACLRNYSPNKLNEFRRNILSWIDSHNIERFFVWDKNTLSHDDVMKWKHFPRYWSFVRGIHQWIPCTKASDAELWCFLRLNKRLSKESWGWWFEMPSRPLWRHRNERLANAMYWQLYVCYRQRPV